MKNANETSGGGFRRRMGWTLLVATCLPWTVTACDFDVSNPGPVEDAILNDAKSQNGVLAGMNRALNDALRETARRTASVSREVFPSGNTGYFGITDNERRGILDDLQSGARWSEAQNARWVAEDGIRRLEEVLGKQASASTLARAYLAAGYANRFLGENFCDAVIDGGKLQPHTAFFERAEQQFTTVMEMAAGSDLATAARAGRASVRVGLNKWVEASSDAGAIPDAFAYRTDFSATEEDQFNAFYFASAGSPYRVFTVWNTVYAGYYTETGDPRTPWNLDSRFTTGDQAIGPFGRVPFYVQGKHTRAQAPVNLSSGREMRLIEAEALLVKGSWQAAMTIVNKLRTSVISTTTKQALKPWTATNLEEAWTAFKREHGIELWLEGRRMAAMRRWEEDQRPGALHPLEIPGEATYIVADRDLCYPVPRSEVERNPNLR